MITNDFFGTDAPPQVSAISGVAYYDTKNRLKYVQTKIPFGESWVLKQKDISPPLLSSVATDGTTIVGNGVSIPLGFKTLNVSQFTNDSGYITGIADNSITYGKIQQVSALKLLGNPTGSTANVSEIPLGSGLSFVGGALVASTPTLALADSHIFVGNASNVAADVALTLNASGGTFGLSNAGVLTMPNADASTRGLLTSTDWNTFNNKVSGSLTAGRFPYTTGANSLADTPNALWSNSNIDLEIGDLGGASKKLEIYVSNSTEKFALGDRTAGSEKGLFYYGSTTSGQTETEKGFVVDLKSTQYLMGDLAGDVVYIDVGTNSFNVGTGSTKMGFGGTLFSFPTSDGSSGQALKTNGAGVLSWGSFISGTASALTTGNDTNITLTAGGSSATALLAAASITAGWTGTLSGARGGTGVANTGHTIAIAANFATTGTKAATLAFPNGIGTNTYTFPTASQTLASLAGTETFTGAKTFNTNNLTITDINVVLSTATGTKWGTATNQLQSFWNATPIAQPTTAIAASTFVTNTSLIANDSATWDGYTIGQVVKALRNVGLLA